MSNLNYFKEIVSLFAIYSFITEFYLVYKWFKYQYNGLNKIKKSTFFLFT